MQKYFIWTIKLKAHYSHTVDIQVYLLNLYLSWAPDISAMSWSLVIHILSEIEENTYIIEENTYFAILLLDIEGSTYLIEDDIEAFSLNIEENTYLLLPSISYKIEG